jgi:hypothetical protein
MSGCGTASPNSSLSEAEAVRPTPLGLGKWDGRQVGRPFILALEGSYWMFYAGSDMWGEWKIGAATSADGIAWDRLDDDAVIVPPASRLNGGGWHSYESPWAGLTADGFRLFACGTGDKPLSAIVSFMSRDGVTWTDPAIELEAPPISTDGVFQVRDPWIVDADGEENLFVTRVHTTANDRTSAIVRNVRSSGGEWTESGERIVDPDGGLISLASVLRTERGWTLWCSSFVGDRYRIQVAYSPDLASWSVPKEIIAGEQESPHETQGVFGPMVIRDAAGYRMWHLTSSRTSDGFSVAVRLRRSDDGEAWTVVTKRPVFLPRPGVPVRPW